MACASVSWLCWGSCSQVTTWLLRMKHPRQELYVRSGCSLGGRVMSHRCLALSPSPYPGLSNPEALTLDPHDGPPSWIRLTGHWAPATLPF